MLNFQFYFETFQKLLQTNNVTLITSFMFAVRANQNTLFLNGVILRRFEMSASDVMSLLTAEIQLQSCRQ